jgi:diguanylate cyclase (GGDEF)-like protein/PAS domain S-box-containing protein
MTADIEQDHEALLQFLYMAPIGLVQTRLDGEILMINPLSSQLLMPMSRDGGLANLFTVLEPLLPDLRYRVDQFDGAHGMVVDALQLQVPGGVQGHKHGPKQAQYLSLSLLKLDDERLMAVLGDVTQSVQRERALRQNQAWIDALVVGLADYALLSLDAAGRIQAWNPGIGRVTGFTRERTVGHSCALFYPPEALSADGVRDRLHEADRAGWSLDEGWRQRADGTRFWGSCLIAPLEGRDGTRDALHHEGRDAATDKEPAYSLIIRDVSDRREAAEALRQAIACDHLTGLANRRAFFEAAEVELLRWVRSPRPLSVVMIDADHFKAVNDRHGHAAGDAVLRHLAAALSSTFRDVDVVARIGGEEFAVLLPGATLEGAEALAWQLCRRFASQAVEMAGARIACTVSAGVASMAPGTAGIDGLLNDADAALYAAKANGRNRVACWHSDPGRATVAAQPA